MWDRFVCPLKVESEVALLTDSDMLFQKNLETAIIAGKRVTCQGVETWKSRYFGLLTYAVLPEIYFSYFLCLNRLFGTIQCLFTRMQQYL
jgi:hypothetical protein